MLSPIDLRGGGRLPPRGWWRATINSMPNGPTAFLQFSVEGFAGLLKALLPDVEVGVRFMLPDPSPQSVTATDALEAVLAHNHQWMHVVIDNGALARRRVGWSRRIAVAGSFGAILAGLYWFVQRVFSLEA